MIFNFLCVLIYIFYYFVLKPYFLLFSRTLSQFKTSFSKKSFKTEKSTSLIHISCIQIQLFSRLSCLFLCTRMRSFYILTLMNKKIHETRLSSGNLGYRSPAFWFSRTQMRQQHRSIQIQTLLQHIVFIQKPLTVFMTFTPFLFPINLVGILSLYTVSVNLFLIISVIIRHFRFQKCLSVNSNLFLTYFFTSFLTNADRTFTIKYRTDG